MWHGHHGGFHFFFLGPLLAMLVLFLILRFTVFRRRFGYCRGGYDSLYEAEAILKKRLASNEITEEEYQRLREVLRK